jgi:hypothetical protein
MQPETLPFCPISLTCSVFVNSMTNIVVIGWSIVNYRLIYLYYERCASHNFGDLDRLSFRVQVGIFPSILLDHATQVKHVCKHIHMSFPTGDQICAKPP